MGIQLDRYKTELALLGYCIRIPDPGALLGRLASVEFLDARHDEIFAALRLNMTEAIGLDPADFLEICKGFSFPNAAAYFDGVVSAGSSIDSNESFLNGIRFLTEVPPEAAVGLEPGFYPIADFSSSDPIELPPEVLKGMPAGTLSFLHGPEDIGKTSLALQLAICKALGRDFFGAPTGDPAPVLFVAMETGTPELQARIHAIAKKEDFDVAELSKKLSVITATELAGRVLSLAEASVFERSIARLEAELVIVDHLSAISPDESDLGQVEVISVFAGIARRTESAFLVLDHDNKGGFGERSAHSGRTLKRRAPALTLWMSRDSSGSTFLDIGKGRFLAKTKEDRGRLWLSWESLADPWERRSLGRDLSWGYLSSSDRADPPKVAEAKSRSKSLLALLTVQWIGTTELVSRAAARGIVQGSYPDRAARRYLSKLKDEGLAECKKDAGARGFSWRLSPSGLVRQTEACLRTVSGHGVSEANSSGSNVLALWPDNPDRLPDT